MQKRYERQERFGAVERLNKIFKSRQECVPRWPCPGRRPSSHESDQDRTQDSRPFVVSCVSRLRLRERLGPEAELIYAVHERVSDRYPYAEGRAG
jgi:hypothetical protein